MTIQPDTCIPAPPLWSVKHIGTRYYEIWVDGIPEGKGTLLATLAFDGDWSAEARRVNAQMIADCVNEFQAKAAAL